MRLLFDENLSPQLCRLLEDIYPGSESVLSIGLGGRSDLDVWHYAIERGMFVVAKDSDFFERAMVSGGETKFVWLRLGNCTTEAVHEALRKGFGALMMFAQSENVVIELP